MDELLKKILEQVIECKPDFKVEAHQEAAEIAELNKILFDAHVAAGFTAEQALALVVAQNN